MPGESAARRDVRREVSPFVAASAAPSGSGGVGCRHTDRGLVGLHRVGPARTRSAAPGGRDRRREHARRLVRGRLVRVSPATRHRAPGCRSHDELARRVRVLPVLVRRPREPERRHRPGRGTGRDRPVRCRTRPCSARRHRVAVAAAGQARPRGRCSLPARSGDRRLRFGDAPVALRPVPRGPQRRGRPALHDRRGDPAVRRSCAGLPGDRRRPGARSGHQPKRQATPRLCVLVCVRREPGRGGACARAHRAHSAACRRVPLLVLVGPGDDLGRAHSRPERRLDGRHGPASVVPLASVRGDRGGVRRARHWIVGRPCRARAAGAFDWRPHRAGARPARVDCPAECEPRRVGSDPAHGGAVPRPRSERVGRRRGERRGAPDPLRHAVRHEAAGIGARSAVRFPACRSAPSGRRRGGPGRPGGGCCEPGRLSARGVAVAARGRVGLRSRGAGREHVWTSPRSPGWCSPSGTSASEEGWNAS